MTHLCRCSQWLDISKHMLNWKRKVYDGYRSDRFTNKHIVAQRSVNMSSIAPNLVPRLGQRQRGKNETAINNYRP